MESVQSYKKSVDIYRELVTKNPKVHLANTINALYHLSISCIYIKEYTNSEQYCNEILKLDSTYIAAKITLAHTLFFQNRLLEAETMYKELSKTIYQDSDTCTQTILNDFNEFEKNNIFSEEQKINIEKIKQMIK
jgi:tetratricopeptide (TPR) repeat protein